MLGGRYKRLYEATEDAAVRGRYLDLAERARDVANVAREACLPSMHTHPTDVWARWTLLGLAFDIGDVVSARDLLTLEALAARA